MSKSTSGNFFEDFRLGQEFRHAVPRTITTGDVSLYSALYGMRFPVQSSDAFARSVGLSRAPIDTLLLFHVVFGKTVPDISLNAVANLGYADGRFLRPVFVGDTLSTTSEVIGLKQTSAGDAGIVYVRSIGRNQHGEIVLSYARWVLVRKRQPGTPAHAEQVPDLAKAVLAEELGEGCPVLDLAAYDDALAGSRFRWGDYAVGETIDHVDGMTVEEAEHQLATRLYQNTARVHFDGHAAKGSRFGKRLIYGGHVISLARALSCAHLPLDGDTVFAASTARQPLAGPEEFMELCHIAGQVMARAIARGVYEATALPYAGALPAWRDQFADLRP